MHCRKVRGELVNFLEGKLDDELAHAISEHLIVCEECFEESEAIREILSQAGNGFGADPVVLAQGYLEGAALAHASALHCEPGVAECRIRQRVDGVLEEVEQLPPNVGRQVINQLKLLAGMRLAARHLPQHAHMRWHSEDLDRDYDLQLSTLPTPSGDSLVVRMQYPGGMLLSLTDLGLRPEDLGLCEQLLSHDSGVLVVAAPPESGRTTTLYAFLQRLQHSTCHIVTLESPVETPLAGVTQVPVIEDAHLSFDSAVKHALTHDPDVLMCGDMPDLETVRACLQAGMGERLVIAGFTAQTATETLRKLLKLGAERFLLTTALKGIIAQRLVRRLCDLCKQNSPATPAEAEWLAAQTGRPEEGLTVWRAKGCEACRAKGYRGQVGVFEVLPMDEPLRSLILAGADADEITEHVLQTIHPIAADAAEKALAGLTTVEEAGRVS